jgi:hypothetical protein
MIIRNLTTIAVIATAGFASTGALAQTTTSTLTPYSLSSSSYSQNFNSLAATGESSTLPAGWQISETGSSNAANGRYTASTGSINSGDVYSYGSAGSSDRALGTLFSGSNSPVIGMIFTNGLNSAITSLTFDFAGEQWRAAAATSDRLKFQYLVGATSIASGTWVDFSALDVLSLINGQSTAVALDGNADANRALYNGTITGLNIAAGQSFGFRWVDLDGPGGADHGLAIDDLTINATTAATSAVPEPATWGMIILGFGAMAGAVRRRNQTQRVRFA